ncbi:MAG: FAD-dependent oxidoreductase, partial [Lactobacillus apis]|nr:FAD-dependent oxidoreductase [Lactobacillus apis]
SEFEYGDVQSVTIDGENKVVKTDTGEYSAPALIIATGADHRHLNVPGEEEYSGKGVSYCAVCDAAFFKDEDIAVIGGGDSAIEEGIYLAQSAKSVTVIHRRDQLRAQPTLQKRAFANDKINFIWNGITESIDGDGQRVTGVTYKDKETGEEKQLATRGVFIYVGVIPQTAPFKELGITDEQGWIPTDDHMRTKADGIFALGDVRAKDLRQIANAVGDGSIAGQAAYNYLQDLNDK